MTQTAVVISVISPVLCEVRAENEPACNSRCGGMCGKCENLENDILAVTKIKVEVGDIVMIQNDRTLPLAAVVFLLPLLLFFGGWWLHPIVSAVGLLVGIGAVMVVNRFLQSKGGVSARVVAVIKGGDSRKYG
jgi:positive regulator of sigma E activity